MCAPLAPLRATGTRTFRPALIRRNSTSLGVVAFPGRRRHGWFICCLRASYLPAPLHGAAQGKHAFWLTTTFTCRLRSADLVKTFSSRFCVVCVPPSLCLHIGTRALWRGMTAAKPAITDCILTIWRGTGRATTSRERKISLSLPSDIYIPFTCGGGRCRHAAIFCPVFYVLYALRLAAKYMHRHLSCRSLVVSPVWVLIPFSCAALFFAAVWAPCHSRRCFAAIAKTGRFTRALALPAGVGCLL